MNKIKKAAALLLCMVMCMPGLTAAQTYASANEDAEVQASGQNGTDANLPGQDAGMPGQGEASGQEDAVRFNTGRFEYQVMEPSQMESLAEEFERKYGAAVSDLEAYEQNEDAVAEAKAFEHYTAYDEDGRCRISIEEDAFFPYEVQFSYDGEVTSEWFLTREDTVNIKGHEFYLDAPVTGKVLTQMSLNVGGDAVTVYPEEKEFTDEEGGQTDTASLLPLKEVSLSVDLTGYTPLSMTKVSLWTVFGNTQGLPQDMAAMWRTWGVNDSTDKDTDYHIVSMKDKLDLSFASRLEVIAGKASQLASDNIRYFVSLKMDGAETWLEPEIYVDKQGSWQAADVGALYRNTHLTYVDGREKDVHMLDMQIAEEEEGERYFLSLNMDLNMYPQGKTIRVYEGEWTEDSLKEGAKDITNEICDVNMLAAGSGYPIKPNMSGNITIVSYENNEITGCLPVMLMLDITRASVSIDHNIYQKESNGTFLAQGYWNGYAEYENGLMEYTYRLFFGPADGKYFARFTCRKNGGDDSARSDLSAYIGRYESAEKAQASGAQNIKDSLFGDGYEADYSQGVIFSVFIGYRKQYYCIKTEEAAGTEGGEKLNGSTWVRFQGVMAGSESAPVDTEAYISRLDSYGDNNFYTIFADRETEDGTEINLNHLAMDFETEPGVTLYKGKSSTGTPVKSCETFIDFSGGMVQFTAVSENKENSENYYIRVLQPKTAEESSADNEEQPLYINSLEHESAQTQTGADGVLISKREIMLDSRHENRHNILLVNTAVTTMSALKAELNSDYLVMDEYWNLEGKEASDLSGFTTARVQDGLKYGTLPNLAQLRLRAKSSDIEPNDYDNLGTLVITSGSKTLMILNLSGTIGDPHITTEDKDIKPLTQYVPYGTVIENSNKYTYKNRVSYSYTGTLPKGMNLAPSGELYGVPMETGTFTFTVTLHNHYQGLKNTSKTFHITVQENTDSNVNGAQDAGYEITEPILSIEDTDADGNYQLLSVGMFQEFFELYIDGEKLVKGTDYWAREGSTRITIASQSLKKTPGRHTIGVEFHKDRKDRQIRAGAQNYYAGSSGNNTGSSGGSSGSGSGSSSGGNPGAALIGKNPPAPSNPTVTPPAPSNPGSTQPSVPPVQPEPQEPPVSRVIQQAKTYTVKAGDTLRSIAKKYYGKASLWKRIYDANSDKIPDSRNLKPGTKLVIPALSYTVKKGDTIQSIAKKYYGGQSKWQQIYNANKDVLSSPQQLKPGDKLVLPVPVVRTVYKVRKGDTLQSIAQNFYGDTDRWKLIYEANKSKASASGKVKAGRTLLIPAMAYTVKKGDTTKDIAKKYYGAQGKWKIIYNANKDVIPSSQKLKTGSKLVIPVPLCRKVYQTAKGDTLKSISKKFYGKESKWKKIYSANQNKVSASGRVTAGRKLVIPALNCTAAKGDSLKSLAKKYYGKTDGWTKIYNANRDVIPASKKIEKGMKLVIPVPAEL